MDRGASGRDARRVRIIRNRLVRVRKEIYRKEMGYSKEKEKYQVTEIDITLDTDDKEEQEREYINNITSRIMEIANDYIHRHPNIDICTSQGITELFKDIKRKYKADINNIKELNILWDIYTCICCTCRIKPTLMRYCIMVGISQDTMNSWIKGEYAGRVTSGHSESAQNGNLNVNQLCMMKLSRAAILAVCSP